MEHPELVIRAHRVQKHSNDNWKFCIGMIVGILVMMVLAFAVRADEYIITEIHTQDNAVEIFEAPPIGEAENPVAPPINDISTDLDVEDARDDCPYNSAVPLASDVQRYIWEHCKAATRDFRNYYTFILGAIQLESEFKRTAYHENRNGSVDRGLMQINSSNIKECKNAGLISSTDDLWDIYKNIDCGFHEMDQYVAKHGVCENAYYAYNTGNSKGGSNKNSRVVMQNMEYWQKVIFG